MTRVKISELRDHLSRHLRDVEKGAEVVVMDRDRPIARIVPIEDSEKQVRIIPGKGSFARVRDRHYEPARWKISSTELLLEDRRKH